MSDNNVNSSGAAKRQRTPPLEEPDEDRAKLCTICLEDWTRTGEHRICALRCGHLYGHKCIASWISSNKNCPLCKKKTKQSDIRFLYGCRLVAVDTSELEVKRKERDALIEKIGRLNLKISKDNVSRSLLEKQIENCIQELQMQSSSQQKIATKAPSLRMTESINVCNSNSCRVMDMHTVCRKLVVSMKSQNNFNLFQGYGAKKFSDDFRPLEYVPLHTKPIRDLKFDCSSNSLLSVSLDKVAKIIDVQNNQQIGSYPSEKMLWSCCWDADDPNYFYIGDQNGSISKLDVRCITEPVQTYQINDDLSPVVSIVSISSNMNSAFSTGSFIACSLNSVCAFEAEDSLTYNSRSIVVDGPFTSMSLHSDNKQLLISSRPNSRELNSRHRVYSLEKSDGDDSLCRLVHTFKGGGLQKLMSRTCFWDGAKDDLYIAAQRDSMVSLWNVNSGVQCASSKLHSPVIDFMPVSNESGRQLLALSESKLFIYKFTDE